MKNFNFLAAITVALFAMSSCKKDKEETTPTTSTGTVEINFGHRWVTPTSNFLLNLEVVQPMTNDTLTFTTFKYYVSNVKFKKADGTWWIHPDSYFLVDLSQANGEILSIPNVPTGEYTDMEYTLGVDSLKNVSGAQTGALSVSNNMFWSWNSGYIMLKAEGTSPNSTSGSFSFHLGGFSGSNNVVTVKNVNFTGNSMTISKNNTTEVHMLAYPNLLWSMSPSVNTTNTIHMPGSMAQMMALDFYNGIVFDHLHE